MGKYISRSDMERHRGQILVEHPNGYWGCLYGTTSMSIYKDGKEVMHTSQRAVNSPKELYETLEDMPNFLKMLFES